MDEIQDDELKGTEDDELDVPLSVLGGDLADDDVLADDLTGDVVDDEDDVADFGGGDE